MANVLATNDFAKNTNENIEMKFGAPGSLFNLDGSKPGVTNENKFIGGKNMANLTGAWTKDNAASTTYDAKNPNTVDWGTPATNTTTTVQSTGGFQVDGASFSGTAQTTQVTKNVSPAGANWGDSNPVVSSVVNGVTNYDKSGIAIQAIKDLAGKLMQITNNLNTEEFNTFVKIFDFAGLKDEFLARSGRRDSYLDRDLLVQAINEANMVFTENNQKNQNIISSLQNIGNTLDTTGVYDAANIYKFILDCVNSGAIPQSVQNDNMRQNLNKVIRMALAYKNNGGATGISASGANWGTNNNNNGAWSTGGTNWADNNTPWSGTTNWGMNVANNGGPSPSTINWGASTNNYTQTINWGAGVQNDAWVSTPNSYSQVGSVDPNPYNLYSGTGGKVGNGGFDWGSYGNNRLNTSFSPNPGFSTENKSAFNPMDRSTYLK